MTADILNCNQAINFVKACPPGLWRFRPFLRAAKKCAGEEFTMPVYILAGGLSRQADGPGRKAPSPRGRKQEGERTVLHQSSLAQLRPGIDPGRSRLRPGH